jgi:hypothetical protein
VAVKARRNAPYTEVQIINSGGLMSMLQEFKAFAIKGNVMDLAVELTLQR